MIPAKNVIRCIAENILTIVGDFDVDALDKGFAHINNKLDSLIKHAEQTARSSSSHFSTYLGAQFFENLARNAVNAFYTHLKDFVTKSLQVAKETQQALAGIGSIADMYKIDNATLINNIKNLDAVKRGFLTTADAIKAVKPALSFFKGDMDKAIEVVDIFSKSAAFNRQATLDYAEAIISATEGLKNNNNIAIDNAGITKNLAIIMKELGYTTDDLYDKQKAAAAQEALIVGFRREAAGQMDDLTKYSATYTGSISRQEAAMNELNNTVGKMITDNLHLRAANQVVTEQIIEYTKSLDDADSATRKHGINAIKTWAEIKAAAIPTLGAIINGVMAFAQALAVIPSLIVGSVIAAIDILFGFLQRFGAALSNLVIKPVNNILSAFSELRIPEVPYADDRSLTRAIGIRSGQDIINEALFVTPKRMSEYWSAAKSNWNDANEAIERMTALTKEFSATEKQMQEERAQRDKEREARLKKIADDAERLEKGSGDKKAGRAAAKMQDREVSGILSDIRKTGLPLPQSRDSALNAQIREIAARFNIPEWLAFAQIKAESSFQTDAISRNKAGQPIAYGLTQFRPATASNVMGRRVTGEELIKNPELALTAWGKYMTQLYAKYGGSWELALLAYHNGEDVADRLARLLDAGKDKAADKFLKDQPKGRAYIKNAMRFEKSSITPDITTAKEFSSERFNVLSRVGMMPQFDAQGRVVRYVSQDKPIVENAQMPNTAIGKRRTVDEEYVKSNREDLDREFTNLALRQRNFASELEDIWTKAWLTRKNLEFDLIASIRESEVDLQFAREEAADDHIRQLTRTSMVKSEELPLIRELIRLEDERATMGENAALRYQVAWSRAINDIKRKDFEALESMAQSQAEMDDQTVFHSDRARARIMEHFASQKGITDIWADGFIGATDKIGDKLESVLDKVTRKFGIFGDVIKDILANIMRLALNRIFMKLLDGLLPSSASSNSQGASKTVASGVSNALRMLSGQRGAGGLSSIGGFAGGNAAGIVSGSGGSLPNFLGAPSGSNVNIGGTTFRAIGGGLFPVGQPSFSTSGQLESPTSITQQQAQQAQIERILETSEPEKQGWLVDKVFGGNSASARAGITGGMLGMSIGASLGGESRLGSILGAIGGIGVGVAAGSIGSAINTFGTSIALATTSTLMFATLGIGAALLVGAVILGRNAKRRAAEKERNQLTIDTRAGWTSLIKQAERGNLDIEGARSAVEDMRKQYMERANALKDSKTKRIALKQWDDDYSVFWPKLEAAARRSEAAASMHQNLIPTFASGGHVGSVASPPNGLTAGRYNARNEQYVARFTGNEVILNPRQWRPLTPFLKAMNVPGFAGGGRTNNSYNYYSAPSNAVGIGQIQIAAIIVANSELGKAVSKNFPRSVIIDTVRDGLQNGQITQDDLKSVF